MTGALAIVASIAAIVLTFLVRAARVSANRIKDSATRHRMILNSAKDGILTLSRDGTITGLNPAVEKMFGYAEAELLGQSVGQLYEEKPNEQQVRFFFAQVMAHPDHGKTREFGGLRSDGSRIVCNVSVTPMRLSDGFHFVAIVRDITKLKQVERLKNEFVATVSHELRTPLTSISGSLGLIAGGAAGELPEAAARLVKIAHNNCERLVRLVNDILDIEKLQSGEMKFDVKALPLIPLLNEAVVANAAFADKYQVKLRLEIDDVSPVALVDRDRVAQVLTNLISNACKFSNANGVVTVSTSSSSRFHRISVHNNGAPIPDEFKSRIFSKFAQAESSDARASGGTGLGLSIVKEIVTRLGGSVGFESSADAGTTFHVDLPKASQAEIEEAPYVQQATRAA